MKAVGLYRYLPVSSRCFEDVEIPKPKPGSKDLLVRVKAVSVNPVDVKIRASKPDVETVPRILGWDAAGIVEEVGENVSLFSKGVRCIIQEASPDPAQTVNIIKSMNGSPGANPVICPSLKLRR